MFRKRRLARLLILPFLFLASAAAFAVQPDEMLSDPALEARARALSAELRCVVCQNQSIDDSNAPLARDLRILLRERLAAGDSDEEVKTFLVERYGAFVLLKPPFDARTIVLWLTPLIILAVAGAILLRRFTRLSPAPTQAGGGLSPQEEQRLRELLADEDGETHAVSGSSAEK